MVNRAPPATYYLGSGSTALSLRGWEFPVALEEQSPQGIRTGYEVERATREHVFPFRLTDLSGGFLATSGIYDAGQFRNRVYKNEGLMCHLPGLACLAFKSTAQTALDNIDTSGFRATNKRVHSIMSTLGVSGAQMALAVGAKAYKPTTTSNPALTLMEDSLTDSVLSIANLKLNSVDYTAVSTDGTTNDTRGTTDVTGADPFSGGTELITHAHADDGFFAMDFYPTMGGSGWNVFVGIINQVNGIYCCKSTATVPQSSTTLIQVVDTSTKAIRNSSNTILDSGFVFASRGFEAIYEGGTLIGSAGQWNTPNNLTANDNAFATTNTADAAPDSLLCGYFTGFNIPESAQITGYTFRYRRLESHVDINAATIAVRLFRNPDAVVTLTSLVTENNVTLEGLNPADMDTAEWGTTEEAIEDGGSTDLWGTAYTPAQINAGIGVALAMDQGSVASQNSKVDSMELKVHWRLPGAALSLPTGGWQPGKAPHRAHRMAYITPTTNELATVNKPRQVYFLDFEYDPDGDRPTTTISMPATQLAYVDDANWFQGGLAVSGGNSSGPGIQMKLIDDSGVTRDLGFPAVHGSTAVRVVAMFAVGAVLMYYVCDNASTDAQLWMYYNGRHHAFGALFSKTLGGAMSTQPLGWAEKTIETFQSQMYSIFPSSTNTAAIYQFVPADPLNADPFLVNTSQTKQDGPLYVQTLELDVLPEEANKSFTALQCQSRRIDNNTSYGSLVVQINIAGDHTFAVDAITTAQGTFDAAAEIFTDRNLATSGDPGVAFRSAIFRLTAAHEASTAETPNLLPVLFYVVAQWAPMKKFGITLAAEQNLGPMSLVDKIEDMMAAKSVQRFQYGSTPGVAVKVVGYDFAYARLPIGLEPGWDNVKSAVLLLAEVPGGIS